MFPLHFLLALAAVAVIAYIGRRIGASELEFFKWLGAFGLFAGLATVVVGLLYSPAACGVAVAWLIGYAMGLAQRKFKDRLS